MSLTTVTWILLFVGLSVLSLRRSIWGSCVYFLAFFAFPTMWWWAGPLRGQRWGLYSGLIFLASVALALGKPHATGLAKGKKLIWFMTVVAIAMFVNSTLVHFCLAPDRDVSSVGYTELAKFVLLYFLLVASVREPRDLGILLMTFALGTGYIGYEVWWNERGHFDQGRLEGVGAPGAFGSNHLANLCVSLLPLIGWYGLAAPWLQRIIAIVCTGLTLNVLLLCNSRGHFLGACGACAILPLVARGPARKRAILALILGAIALYMTLGDERIIARFKTAFAPAQQRDSSASSRLIFWQAGRRMIADHPFGAGGDGFKFGYGPQYLREFGEMKDRSLHHGYYNEACEWGLQGLALRLLFLAGAVTAAMITISYQRRRNPMIALFGACVISAITGFMISNFFTDRLTAEWCYWLVAVAVAYYRLYGPAPTTSSGAEAVESVQVNDQASNSIARQLVLST
jgi:hypothetical protein